MPQPPRRSSGSGRRAAIGKNMHLMQVFGSRQFEGRRGGVNHSVNDASMRVVLV